MPRKYNITSDNEQNASRQHTLRGGGGGRLSDCWRASAPDSFTLSFVSLSGITAKKWLHLLHFTNRVAETPTISSTYNDLSHLIYAAGTITLSPSHALALKR